jgi:hypothetical protein
MNPENGALSPKMPRAALLAVALLVLLAAMWAGLIRMGWVLSPIQPMLPALHGPLMVCGFLGVLLSLERAVALSAPLKPGDRPARRYYLSPLLTALGSLILLVGVADWPGPLLVTLGSMGLVLIFAIIIRRQPALFTVMMGLGALTWLIGNVLWLSSQPIFNVVLWWVGFPLLTVAGERLELSRLFKLSVFSRVMFLASAMAFLIGAALLPIDRDLGTRLAGVGELALALWLIRYDVAGRTVRRTGLTRYIAICLLLGYLWLGVGGVLSIVQGSVLAGPAYDAMLHTLFVGFAMSMIFGHAPIILPAILGIPVSYRAAYYTHLGLLHASMLLRVWGDLAGDLTLRQWGGMLNVIALLLFMANTAYTVRIARRQAQLKPLHLAS